MKKKTIFITIVFLALLLFQLPAMAASGTLNISTSSGITEGDTFDVVVSFSSSGEAIGSLQASIEYDDSMISYTSGGGNAVEMSNGTGGISDIGNEDIYNLTYVLRFTALKSGTASFKITNHEIIGFISGDDLSSGAQELKIDITSKSSSDEPPQNSQPAENTDPIAVTVGGSEYYILRDFGDKAVPSGFESGEITYEGQKVTGAINDNLALKLLCLMDSSGNTGLYLYFEDDSSFFPYVSLVDEHQFIISDSDSSLEGFTRGTIDFNGKTIPAWTSEDEQATVVYALTSDGQGAFYYFDAENGILLNSLSSDKIESSTLDNSSPEPKPSEDAQTSSKYSPWTDNSTMLLLYGLGGVAVILIIAVIIAGIKKKHK